MTRVARHAAELSPGRRAPLRRIIGLLSGIADSGFAAVANLGMGLFAVHTLSTDDLAIYSLFFSGWVTAQLIPAQLAYLPARLAINSSATVVRPRIGTDIRRGTMPIVGAAIVAGCAGLPLISKTSWEEYIVVAASVAALTLVAPLQDHVRRSLHIIGRHTAAAVCSAVTCLVAVITLASFYWIGSDHGDNGVSAAITFGSLAAANLAGAVYGFLALTAVPRADYSVPGFLTRLGYLGPDFVAQTSGYLVSVIAAGLLGTAAVASLETARVMSSPVVVIVAGLSAYLVPNTVRIFVKADLPRFRKRLIGMSTTVVAAGGLYALALVAAGNQVSRALGTHADSLLGASRACVATLDASSSGSAFLLFTAKRTKFWNVTSVAGSALTLICVVPGALLFGPFGVVLAQGVGTTFKSAVGLRASYMAQPPRGTATN